MVIQALVCVAHRKSHDFQCNRLNTPMSGAFEVEACHGTSMYVCMYVCSICVAHCMDVDMCYIIDQGNDTCYCGGRVTFAPICNSFDNVDAAISSLGDWERCYIDEVVRY